MCTPLGHLCGIVPFPQVWSNLLQPSYSRFASCPPFWLPTFLAVVQQDVVVSCTPHNIFPSWDYQGWRIAELWTPHQVIVSTLVWTIFGELLLVEVQVAVSSAVRCVRLIVFVTNPLGMVLPMPWWTHVVVGNFGNTNQSVLRNASTQWKGCGILANLFLKGHCPSLDWW